MKELLTGLETSSAESISTARSAKANCRSPVRSANRAALEKFAARKQVPLTIALTPEQEASDAIVAQARSARGRFSKKPAAP